MNIQQAYNLWAEQYDGNLNRTRDLEAKALREILEPLAFDVCLEIGCGTGKNTEWFAERVSSVTSVDFSEEMLARAREKIKSPKVEFIRADILDEWKFANKKYDLVSFSLVLEHIENLEAVFQKSAEVLQEGGYVYVGELHPFKQILGSKAKFETGTEIHTPDCHTHPVSEFFTAAKKSGMTMVEMKEFFDEGEPAPRVLAMVFNKK